MITNSLDPPSIFEKGDWVEGLFDFYAIPFCPVVFWTREKIRDDWILTWTIEKARLN